MRKRSTDLPKQIETEEKNERLKYRKKVYKEIRWDRLDNTAHLFPVIAGESMSNVYRISVTLKELIQPQALQEALNIVLPKFDLFNVRMRRGMFWYYFEENNAPAPKIVEEASYPCRYIVPTRNHNYLFRVTYYKYRINLEVFHVLTDGMGGINFLKELTYQYLRIVHEELRTDGEDRLNEGTSLNREDSFLKNYKKSARRTYQTHKAFLIKGEHLQPGEFSVMHGYLQIPELKEVCKKYEVSINEYLVGTFVWSVYKECLHGLPSKRPIRVAVPVNLRPYFDSDTTKNFFVMVSAEFHPTKEEYCFDEVLKIVQSSLKSQIQKDNLEKLFSYNVSNEKIVWARMVPLSLKNIAIRLIYTQSALANTATVTNIGRVEIEKKYEPYIEMFYAFLAMSKGQHLKGTICAFGKVLSFNFSSDLADVSVQRRFFRQLAKDGLQVEVETNGVKND